MKLSTKLIITVATGVIGLIAVASVGLQQISRIHKTTVEFSGNYYPSQGTLDDISLGVERLKSIVLEMLIDGRDDAAFELLDKEFTQTRNTLLSDLRKYRELLRVNGIDSAQTKVVDADILKSIDDLYLVRRVVQKHDLTTALEIWQKTDASVDVVLDAIQKEADFNDQLELKGRQESDDAYASALISALMTSGLVILLLGGSAVWAYKSLIDPIKALESKLDEITHSLDLNERVNLGTSEEMRRATDAVNRLLARAQGGMMEIRDRHDEAAYAASHDHLTGLPNRSLALQRLEALIHQARLGHKKVALMFIDLDGFKQVNDTSGHDAGDFVLKEVTRRLKSSLREDDTPARLGGDEFLAMIGGLQDASVAASIARKIIDAISAPLDYQGQVIHIGASVGIAMYPENGADADAVMQAADAAMYQIKRSGKNDFKFAQSP
jgi:diguanylate cyclase (GGDEF)-like protein